MEKNDNFTYSMILGEPPLLISATSALQVVTVGSLIPGSEENRNIYSTFESQWRLAKILFVSSDQMRPSSSSLEGNIVFLKAARIFPKAFHIDVHRLFSVQNWVSQSLHMILHLHKETPVLKWSPEWRVCWGATGSHTCTQTNAKHVHQEIGAT